MDEEDQIPITQFSDLVRKRAYRFDGSGNYFAKDWDLNSEQGFAKEFSWYHVELPKGNQKLAVSAQYMIAALCPPLKLQDILTLVSNGPFCGHVDGSLFFRVNSSGPTASNFTLRLAARVTENSIITVSLGRVPRLGFKQTGQSLLSVIPSVGSVDLVRGEEKAESGGVVIEERVLESLLMMNHSEEADNPVPKTISNLLLHIVDTHVDQIQDIVIKLEIELDAVEIELDKGRVPRLGFKQIGQSLLSVIPSVGSVGLVRGEEKAESGGVVIEERVLESLLMMNHSEEADNPVPKTISNLLLHIVDTHVDQIQDIVIKLEIELDAVEIELDKGGSLLKKQMLDDRRFPKMHLNLQRLLQVVSYGEQVFPRVKEKCAMKTWFANEDIIALEELLGRLRRLKENLGFIANRVAAVQAGLDSWQAEQINRKLYCLSFLSVIFLPLSIITGIFGMNVGGVPWTLQNDPAIKDGFINVMKICGIVVFFLLFCFGFPSLYDTLSTRRSQLSNKWSFILNKAPFLMKRRSGLSRREYSRI